MEMENEDSERSRRKATKRKYEEPKTPPEEISSSEGEFIDHCLEGSQEIKVQISDENTDTISIEDGTESAVRCLLESIPTKSPSIIRHDRGPGNSVVTCHDGHDEIVQESNEVIQNLNVSSSSDSSDISDKKNYKKESKETQLRISEIHLSTSLTINDLRLQISNNKDDLVAEISTIEAEKNKQISKIRAEKNKQIADLERQIKDAKSVEKHEINKVRFKN